jgi:predicted transcriptional regulator
MQKNSEILKKVLELTGCENNNQLATYLTEKYGINISRQQINQFKNSERLTITHLILREFSENA